MTDLTEKIAELNRATRRRIKRRQPLYASLKVDRRLYSKTPIRACQFDLKKKRSTSAACSRCLRQPPRYLLRLTEASGRASRWNGPSRRLSCSQKAPSVSSSSVCCCQRVSHSKEGISAENRYQILYEENAPLPSKHEIELEFGARTGRWQ